MLCYLSISLVSLQTQSMDYLIYLFYDILCAICGS